ncbi:glycosyltransferase family 2 protein [Pseudonocardia eucalypti]|uniref:4,4'-diaponeurosporenoate glycosyltransferase n=1 Tax=Pseudonocardia eucalypti TaxID=648755 RepID=A0ABP9PJK5_9PSEU|nr:hypothetical protein [Pseudonocardia eucalypti]
MIATVIDAVGVVLPAHDEEDLIRESLRGVRAALRGLDGQCRTAVTVVLDRCTDRTPSRVAAELAGWAGAQVLPVHHRPAGTGVGYLRDLGVRDIVRRLSPVAPERIWLLSTDADTTVPESWVAEHLRHARAGAHGVAGLAELSGEPGLSAEALEHYRTILDDGMNGDTHQHVYAANLGLRADVYHRCGGFPLEGPGEEHRLWQTMSTGGHRLHRPTQPRVRTSARLRGRAEGGLADLLRGITERR